MIELETPRLLLRTVCPEDAPHFFELNSDPEVIRYTGDGPFRNVGEAADKIAEILPYSKIGLGRLAVIEKTSNTFIGWSGLKALPDEGEVDLGYRFHQRYWGQGFATETALASLKLGFKTLGLAMIVGRAMLANSASIRVLRKVGMQDWYEMEEDGVPMVRLRLARQDFKPA